MTDLILQKIEKLPEEAAFALEEYINFLYEKYVERENADSLSSEEKKELLEREKDISKFPQEAYSMEDVIKDAEKQLGYRIQINGKG